MHLILGDGTAYQPEFFWSTEPFLVFFSLSCLSGACNSLMAQTCFFHAPCE